MTAETNKAFIARYFDALRQDKSPATLDAFIAEDELKQHIALYEASFPGYWLEAEDLIAEGDRVVVRGTVRGVHRGALMDIPPTGREVAVPIFITYRISNGKIVQHWMLVDMPELLRQIGSMPGVPNAA
jgi:predicted ester cyclase